MRVLLSFFLAFLLISCCGEPDCSLPSKSTESDAVTRIGLSFFGAMSPHASDICRNWLLVQEASEHPVTAVLWGSFGHDMNCIRAFWEETERRGVKHTTIFYLSNENGRSKGLLEDVDLRPELSSEKWNSLLESKADLPHVRRIIKDINMLIAPYEDTGNFILVDGLESDFSPLAHKYLQSMIKEEWAHETGTNPINNDCSYVDDSVYCERHHYTATPRNGRCILNGDGQDIDIFGTGTRIREKVPATMPEVLEWKRRGAEQDCLLLLWVAKSQGLHRDFVSTLDRRFELNSPDVIFLNDIIKGE